tara:strand:- start:2225 stop:2818 length:594 start_codon:yes stop_codon:yes gene_type:complete
MNLNLNPYTINTQRDFYYEHLPYLNSNKIENLVSYIKQEFTSYPDGINNNPSTAHIVDRQAWNIFPNTTSHMNFLYSNIIDSAKNANKKFNFDLNTITQLKYFEYSPNSDMGLDWHIDIGPEGASLRKLSFSLILSNKSEYEGGQLEIWLDSTFQYQVPQFPGSITFFPSFLLHRVTPITKGIRRVIVGWLGGTPYK